MRRDQQCTCLCLWDLESTSPRNANASTLQCKLEGCQSVPFLQTMTALTLLGLPPRTLITRSLTCSTSGSDTKGSTILEYNVRNLEVANKHGSRECMVALTSGCTWLSTAEAHCLSIVGYVRLRQTITFQVHCAVTCSGQKSTWRQSTMMMRYRRFPWSIIAQMLKTKDSSPAMLLPP
jgi:hypothetical protein